MIFAASGANLTIMDDTIIAIATPMGRSLKANIRLSGKESISLVKKVFHSVNRNKSIFSKTQISAYGKITIPSEHLNLPANVYIMKSPHSYTREDIVEIHILGIPQFLDILLKYFIQKGARLAQPGEFTKRAFLNGRIDLAQAESVISIIKSGSKRELALSNQLLQGYFSRKIAGIENAVKDLLIQIELSLDFSDQDISIITNNQFSNRLQILINEISWFLKSRGQSAVFNEKLSIALCGMPNAGKSSLFNRLIGRNKAIVTPIPGTTRDVIESEVILNGNKLSLLDTAGIDATGNKRDATGKHLHKIALFKSKEAITNADIFLFVLDASRKTTNNNLSLLSKLLPERTIIVVNKSDLSVKAGLTVIKNISEYGLCRVSALKGWGLKELKAKISAIIARQKTDKSVSPQIINARIRGKLAKTLEHLREAGKSNTADIIAFEIREALNEIGDASGTTTPDAVLNQIFSGFCIGK